MRRAGTPALLAAALLLAACRMAPAQQALPAVLTHPAAEVRLELVAAIQAMSGFARVSLADSDLTRTSELVIERTQQSDGRGGLLQGRELQSPQRFQLQRVDGQCWLLHRPSGQRQRLMHAQCQAVANPQ
jgi:hypothetical protein